MRNYATENLTCVALCEDSSLAVEELVFRYGAFRDWLTDRLYVAVRWSINSNIGAMLRLVVNGKAYSFGEREGWEDAVAEVSWQEALQGGISIQSTQSYYYLTENGVRIPAVPIVLTDFQTMAALASPGILYANHTRRLVFDLTPGEGRQGAVTAMYLYSRNAGTEAWNQSVLFQNEARKSVTLETDLNFLGKEVYLVLEYCTYLSDNGNGSSSSGFVTLNRLTTPVQTVNENAETLFTPKGLGCSMLLDGGKVTVSWEKGDNSDKVYKLSSYILERAVGVGQDAPTAFGRIYAGEMSSFRDTLPTGADTVAYRVKAVSTLGPASAWCTTGVQSVIKSNVYVGVKGNWVRAAAVQVGSHKASPMLRVGQ